MKAETTYWIKYVSLFMGTSSTMSGASLFNTAEDFRLVVFPDNSYTASAMLAVYFTTISISSLFFTHFRVDSHTWLLVSLIGNTVTSAMIPLVCFISNVSVLSSSRIHIHFQTSVGSVILCILTGILGVWISLALSSAMGIGANRSEIDIASCAAGFGLSGCVSFGSWIVFAHIFFRNTNKAAVAYSIASLFAFCVALGIFNLLQYFFFLSHQHTSQPQCYSSHTTLHYDSNLSESIEQSKGKELPICSRSEASVLEDDGSYEILFKKTWLLLFVRFFSFYETFLCFPHIGPRRWYPTRLQSSVLVGVFQVTDFLGRYATVYSESIVLNEKALLWGCFFRCGIVALYYVMAIFYTTLNSFIIQLIIQVTFAFTNGWFTSSSTVQLPGRLSSAKGKSRASALGLFLAFVGIALGMWTSTSVGYLID